MMELQALQQANAQEAEQVRALVDRGRRLLQGIRDAMRDIAEDQRDD